MARIPLLLVGDDLEQPTGLARILGDLARRLHRDYSHLLDVRTCGYAPWPGLPAHGVEQDPTDRVPWPRWVFAETKRAWGADSAIAAYRRWWGDQEGILFTVWDPGRCLPYTEIPLPVTKWGYFAVDAENVNGGISGPAAEAVRRYDRVLAYTEFGSRVLATALRSPAPAPPALPHGLDLNVFRPNQSSTEVARAEQILGVPTGRRVIGCVATNHARKDWGLVAQSMRILLEHGVDLHLWAHTNQPVSEAWSLPQLFGDCGLDGRVSVTPPLGDQDLACCYAASSATIAPGRGEGFCYPLVESEACGTPALHVGYAGGAEQTAPEWRLPPSLYHLVGPYALRRPILAPETVADRLQILLADPDPMRARRAARARALGYDWETAVWSRWKQWVDAGLGHAGV